MFLIVACQPSTVRQETFLYRSLLYRTYKGSYKFMYTRSSLWRFWNTSSRLTFPTAPLTPTLSRPNAVATLWVDRPSRLILLKELTSYTLTLDIITLGFRIVISCAETNVCCSLSPLPFRSLNTAPCIIKPWGSAPIQSFKLCPWLIKK